MSRELNDQDKGKLAAAVRKVVDAAESMQDVPRYSTRADNLRDSVLAAGNVGRKLLSELGEGDGNLPDKAPNLPDSGRGDYDTKGERGTVPQGLTSTASMGFPSNKATASGMQQGNIPPAQAGEDRRNLSYQSNQSHGSSGKDAKALGRDLGLNSDGTQTFGGDKPDAHRENLVPGLSGHPVKRDDRERAGNQFTVDSTTHRAAAAGERTNADTLEGGRKAQEEGGGDSQMRRETDPGSDGNPANVSKPFKGGADTTNTSSEGSGKPDNYFAEKGGNASEPKKYDSENRVATETLGHQEEKARREKEGGQADGGTSRNKDDPFNSENKSATEKSGADKEQEKHQGDEAAKANTNKPQTPAIGKEGDAPTKGKDDHRHR